MKLFIERTKIFIIIIEMDIVAIRISFVRTETKIKLLETIEREIILKNE